MCLIPMSEKDLIEYYELYIKFFGRQKLIDHLRESEAVEDRWEKYTEIDIGGRHRDYASYKNSIDAMKQVLEEYDNKK